MHERAEIGGAPRCFFFTKLDGRYAAAFTAGTAEAFQNVNILAKLQPLRPPEYRNTTAAKMLLAALNMVSRNRASSKVVTQTSEPCSPSFRNWFWRNQECDLTVSAVPNIIDCTSLLRRANKPADYEVRAIRMAPKYIFVTGGVVSSLGKGVAASSIGCLLESRGFKVTLQ